MIALKQFLSFSLALTIVSCAAPVIHNTPSGRPEITMNAKVGKKVQAEIMNLMVNKGYTLKSSNENLLVFEKTLDSFAARLFLGSSYDTTPNARVTYNIIETEKSTRVVASFIAVTNPGSAFEKITDLNGGKATQEIQEALNEISLKLLKEY